MSANDHMYSLAADLFEPNTVIDIDKNEYHRGVAKMVMMSEALGSDQLEDIAEAISKYTNPDLTPEQKRLESLRVLVRAENVSWGELLELQGLAEHIGKGDVELLEAAGVPEH